MKNCHNPKNQIFLFITLTALILSFCPSAFAAVARGGTINTPQNGLNCTPHPTDACYNIDVSTIYGLPAGMTGGTAGQHKCWAIYNRSGFDVQIPMRTQAEFQSFLTASTPGPSSDPYLTGLLITSQPCCDPFRCAQPAYSLNCATCVGEGSMGDGECCNWTCATPTGGVNINGNPCCQVDDNPLITPRPPFPQDPLLLRAAPACVDSCDGSNNCQPWENNGSCCWDCNQPGDCFCCAADGETLASMCQDCGVGCGIGVDVPVDWCCGAQCVPSGVPLRPIIPLENKANCIDCAVCRDLICTPGESDGQPKGCCTDCGCNPGRSCFTDDKCYGRCPATTINTCTLPNSPHNPGVPVFGACGYSGFGGSCNYSCNNGVWSELGNTCDCLGQSFGSGEAVCTMPVSQHGSTTAGGCNNEGACSYSCSKGALSPVTNSCSPWDCCTSAPCEPANGAMPNSTVCPGDDTGIVGGDVTWLAVADSGFCTGRKCEAYCNLPNYAINGNSCDLCTYSGWGNVGCAAGCAGAGVCSATQMCQSRTESHAACPGALNQCPSDMSCCTTWTSQGCSGGPCGCNQRRETRNCDSVVETRCIDDGGCCCGWTNQGCNGGSCSCNQQYQTNLCGSTNNTRCVDDGGCCCGWSDTGCGSGCPADQMGRQRTCGSGTDTDCYCHGGCCTNWSNAGCDVGCGDEQRRENRSCGCVPESNCICDGGCCTGWNVPGCGQGCWQGEEKRERTCGCGNYESECNDVGYCDWAGGSGGCYAGQHGQWAGSGQCNLGAPGGYRNYSISFGTVGHRHGGSNFNCSGGVGCAGISGSGGGSTLGPEYGSGSNWGRHGFPCGGGGNTCGSSSGSVWLNVQDAEAWFDSSMNAW